MDTQQNNAAPESSMQLPQSDEPVNHSECCIAWLADAPPVEGATRAAMIKATRWTSGDVITVSFLDGDPQLQQKVKKVALQWVGPGMANLSLQFRNDTHDTDIRISFRYQGSWSVLGTTCKRITDLTQPTMNYGWLNESSSDADIQRVVLHEFGHALGLTHEHLSPAGGIPWNKEKVIKDLSGPPNNWSLETIERNMFDVPSKNETNYTSLDKLSIMMYPIPAKWTLNGYSVGLNNTLSETDKQFIRQQYP